jgi:hypothetical protein
MNPRDMLLLVGALAPLVAGCRTSTPSQRLEQLYGDVQVDVAEHDLGSRDAWMTRQHERIEEVRAMLEAHEIVSARDHLHAAVVLVETDSEIDLETSKLLALRAAELGEELGFRVAAEAIDKQLVKRGVPQKYGTQYVYEPVLRGWRLYPCDPSTSDAERHAMGVEALAELKAREKQLNEITGGKPN